MDIFSQDEYRERIANMIFNHEYNTESVKLVFDAIWFSGQIRVLQTLIFDFKDSSLEDIKIKINNCEKEARNTVEYLQKRIEKENDFIKQQGKSIKQQP
jgi:hypothetical protein